MKKTRSSKKYLTLSLTALVFGLYWGNTSITTTSYRIRSPRLPKAFDGFRILQITDFHNASFGKNNTRLVEAIRAARPDIIVITGDFIDSRRTDLPLAKDLAKALVDLAPTYYVNGNHEARIADYPIFRQALQGFGIHFLENEATEIHLGEGCLRLVGLRDPLFQTQELGSYLPASLRALDGGPQTFQILLAHRPEHLPLYAQYGMDLVFSGHAHGGQVRLPLVGGIVAPGQGFFPRYDGGHYVEGESQMVVSRGLGNSLFPLRVFNRPELVLAILEKESSLPSKKPPRAGN